MHSHYRANPVAPHLGGIAKLKTLINKERAQAQNSLLLDGGDWTEGQVYYFLGAGIESYRMMDLLGYDVGVLGNHDWLNGPDILYNVATKAKLQTTLVASNIDLTQHSRSAEFIDRFPKYTIKQVGSIRIGFIGLLTYEIIYDHFLKPINIESPFDVAKALSDQLKQKEKVDFVIAISHNRLPVNANILEYAPNLDLIVGAHDHKTTPTPIRVKRPEKEDGILVEAGSWGQYLGKVEFSISDDKKIKLISQQLIPVTANTPEDETVAQRVTALESLLSEKFGEDIFDDHVCEMDTDFPREGAESPLGDLVTDAYRKKANADIALDHYRFINTHLGKGNVTTAQVINALPGVYNPETDQAWTLKTIDLKGGILYSLMSLLLSPQKAADGGAPAFSGIEILYDPVFTSPQNFIESFDIVENQKNEYKSILNIIANRPVIQKMLINGKPIQNSKSYKVAMSGGIKESLDFLNSIIPGMVDLDSLKDSQVESWRILKEYLNRFNKPIRYNDIQFGTRLVTLNTDLAIKTDSIAYKILPDQKLQLSFDVTNFGSTPSAGNSDIIEVYSPLFGSSAAIASLPISSLSKAGNQHYSLVLQIKERSQLKGYFPVGLKINSKNEESHLMNNEHLLWVNFDQPTN